MSSDSEEDFLSADEGSDYDIPKKYVVAGEAEVFPDHSAIETLETIDQSTAGSTEEIDTCTEGINVKVSLFDEEIMEPPSSGNVFSHSTLMKNSKQNATATPLSNKNIESISSPLDDFKILNTELLLTESLKPEVFLPKKSSLICPSIEKFDEIAQVNYSQSHLCIANDKPEIKVIQTTLEELFDITHNEHIDSKLSSCYNMTKNAKISKSIVSSINVTCGLESEEYDLLHLAGSENTSSVDQQLAFSKLDLHSTEKLQSNWNILDEHSTPGNIPDLLSTQDIPDGHSIGNVTDLPPTENVCNMQSIENIHDLLTTVDIPDFNSKPNHFLTKPRKTSKIGLKKPREKLGERIEGKKIGFKAQKPLESISCDSLRSQSTIQDKGDHSIQHFTSKEERREDAHNDTSNKHKMVEDESSWGSAWGSWGTTLLSAASTLTQEVGRGVGSVVELVEEGIGVPSPEELAKEQRDRERVLELEIPDAWQENWSQSDGETTLKNEPCANASRGSAESSVTNVGSLAASRDNACTPDSTKGATSSGGAFSGLGLGGLSSLVSGVSGALETAGSKVVFGGLDTLELIGRRTMDVLQESDPNLRSRKDRLLQHVNKPNLAAVLREAREKAVANPVSGSDGNSPLSPMGGQLSRVTFAGLWDNSTGPAHLEALALIARQCATNNRTLQAALPPAQRREADRASREIMELSEIDEENLTESSIFSERVAATIRELGLPLNADNIAQCWSDLSSISEQYSEGSSLLTEDALDGHTVQSNVVGSCVLLVERLVAVAHKAAELCLTSPHDEIEPIHLAKQYRELVVLGGSQLESCADAVCTGLSSTPQQEKLTPTITNIYMQVCEGSSCLQQSLVHLCTTLQLVQLQRIADPLT